MIDDGIHNHILQFVSKLARLRVSCTVTDYRPKWKGFNDCACNRFASDQKLTYCLNKPLSKVVLAV